MRQRILLFLVLPMLLLTGCQQSVRNETETTLPDQPKEPVYIHGIAIDSFEVDTMQIGRGETLGGILTRAGATQQQVHLVSRLDKEQFDVRSIRQGKTYLTFTRPDSAGMKQLHYMVYEASLRDAYIFRFTDSVSVVHEQKPVRTVTKSAEAVIESSLWNALSGQDLPVELALELSEIYAWTIDFFGLQKGDTIRVYYDEQYVDSTRIGIGRIHAANFYHGRRWQDAYWYEGGVSGYFDHEGKSLRKAFLKAPLNYKRISSHFSYARKHPIHKVVRPHTGVDYAAPTGTPVVSIGDGVVTFKAYKGGGGNTVKIRHNSVYTTAYLHLSGYAKGLAVGQHVKQGQVIGYVGSTGSATGPHLDFRVWKDGTPIDPLKMVSPPVEPVPAAEKEVFDRQVEEMKKHL